jgi:hypothetical protein
MTKIVKYNANFAQQQVRRQNRRVSRKRKAQPINPILVSKLCALDDPFCSHAIGAVQPGGSGEFTIPVTLKGAATVTTNVNGDAWVLMRACNSDLSLGIYGQGTLTATVFTDSIGSFPAYADQVRLVSGGIKWHDIAPSTTSGGMCQVSTVSDLADVLDGVAHTPAEIATAYPTRFLDRRDKGLFVFKPTDVIDYQRFQDPTSATGYTGVSDPWNNLAMYVTGAASTAVIIVEWQMHYECTLNLGATSGLGLKHREFAMGEQYIKDMMDEDSVFEGGALEYGKRVIKRAAAKGGEYLRDYGGKFGNDLADVLGA